MVVGHYEDGDSATTNIGDDKTGVRLQENEKFSTEVSEAHPSGIHALDLLFHPESRAALTGLWFEDTLGRRYRVKGAKKHLKQLFKQFSERHQERT
jgi:hypothetical protein